MRAVYRAVHVRSLLRDYPGRDCDGDPALEKPEARITSYSDRRALGNAARVTLKPDEPYFPRGTRSDTGLCNAHT